jgi:predicted MFS family arabinose efflux permease
MHSRYEQRHRDDIPRFDKDPIETSKETPNKISSTKEIIVLVLPLLLVYISNQWSRFSISYLVDFPTESTNYMAGNNAYHSMNVDLKFTETQYGLLASTSFTILFAFSSLIAGNFSDKYDRKALTLTSCTVWALATLTQSIAHSYEEVLIARFVMGGACAFAAPAAYSLIADRVSEDKAALANSIYASGVYLGGALASLSLLLDDMLGWRDTLALIGWYGLLSVLVSAFVLPSEGKRMIKMTSSATVKENTKPSLTRNTIDIVTAPRVQYLLLASFFRFSAGLIIAIWAPPYYKQVFPDRNSEYAILNALIKGGIGMTSGIMGGYLAGFFRQYRKDTSDTSILNIYFEDDTVLLLVPVISSVLAIPTWYLATHAAPGEKSFEISMFWLAVEYLVAECWFGPAIAVLQSSVEPSMRGTAQGIFVLVGALGNVSPSFIGWMYGNQSFMLPLADLLGLSVCVGYLLSSICFVASVQKNKRNKELM